jgi:histone-lysine N-methyltransferase SETD8
MGRGRRQRGQQESSQHICSLMKTDDYNSCYLKTFKLESNEKQTKNLTLDSVLGRETSILTDKKTHMNLRGTKLFNQEISSYIHPQAEFDDTKLNGFINEEDDDAALLCRKSDVGEIKHFPKSPIQNSFTGIISNLENEKNSLIKSNFDNSHDFGTSFISASRYRVNEYGGFPLDLSKPTQVIEIDSTTFFNSDSNSCDSGVVIEKNTESRHFPGKAITPHRIVCPSPTKNVAHSKSTSPQSNIHTEPEKKIKLKSKKRLIVNYDDEFKESFLPVIKSITAIRVNKKETNKTLTDFFPVRRSVRKTKKEVLEERNRKIEQAVLEGKEDNLEIRVFNEKGRGVVALKNFSRGEFVVEYAGELISYSEAQNREAAYSKDTATGCYMYYFKHKNQQYCIDATSESDRFGRLVNHSRNGNLTPRTMLIQNIPRLLLYAKEEIKLGEEITYDYGDRSKEALIHHPWLAL